MLFLIVVLGFVFFVLTLTRGYYRVQFSLVCGVHIYVCMYVCTVYILLFIFSTQLAWTLLTLIMFVSASHVFIQNVFEGVYWFLMPASLVICNDIMAYVSGNHYEIENMYVHTHMEA